MKSIRILQLFFLQCATQLFVTTSLYAKSNGSSLRGVKGKSVASISEPVNVTSIIEGLGLPDVSALLYPGHKTAVNPTLYPLYQTITNISKNSSKSETQNIGDLSFSGNNNGFNDLELQPRIVGGIGAPSDRFPYFVNMYHLPDPNDNMAQYACGGVLISKSLVLSVAHCGDLVQVVQLGRPNLSTLDSNVETFNIKSVTIHPNFNKGAPYNFGKKNAYSKLLIHMMSNKSSVYEQGQSHRFVFPFFLCRRSDFRIRRGK